MLTEPSSVAIAAEPTSGLDYPGPALDIEDCILESDLDGFNKTFSHMMTHHGRGPWLNQALYIVCSGKLCGIDPDAQREMFNALLPHFDPAIEGVDMYISIAMSMAPWAVKPMLDVFWTRHEDTKECREHIALIACQKAVEGYIEALPEAAPWMFLNHDLSDMFWRKTFADRWARKILWNNRQWKDNPALERMLGMPKCPEADHHVARGLFNQAINTMGRGQAGELAVHLVRRGWLTSEATAIAMAGIAHPEQEKNEQILSLVVRAQLQRRTSMICAAAPGQSHGPRL